MDSVNRSNVTPSNSRLARIFTKVLYIQDVIGANRKPKSQDKFENEAAKKHIPKNNDMLKKKTQFKSFVNEDVNRAAIFEAFLVNLFSNISAIKASYALLQVAQSPYDPDFILSADEIIVSELKKSSELKQCYSKNQFDDHYSPETTRILAEIKELKSVVRMYEIMWNKLDFQLKLKDSEIIFLREELDEVNKENKLLEKRLSLIDNLQLSKLSINHFTMFLVQTIKSIRNFVRLLCREMEYAGWDLDVAALSIQPGTMFLKPNDKYYTFESFVRQEMFDDFNYPYFSMYNESMTEKRKRKNLFSTDSWN